MLNQKSISHKAKSILEDLKSSMNEGLLKILCNFYEHYYRNFYKMPLHAITIQLQKLLYYTITL